MPKIKILISLLVLFTSSSNAGFITSFYNPIDYYSEIDAPNISEISLLDSAVGISEYLIEDFEDSLFVGGFSTNVGIDTEIHGENIFRGAWDGVNALSTIIAPGNDFIMNFAATNSIAFGISGIDHNQRLVVNGNDLGMISNFTGFQDIMPFNGRSIFVRIDSMLGDPLFNEVRINYPSNGPQPDRIQIDRFAIKPVSVAEPSTSFLVSTLIAGALIRRKATRIPEVL